jgi:hypothetical protein
MEAELVVNGQTVPGVAPFDHGNTALDGRENECFSGTPPYNPGLFHTGCGGGANGYFTNPKIWLNGVQLLGDANNCSMGGLINGGDNSLPTADAGGAGDTAAIAAILGTLSSLRSTAGELESGAPKTLVATATGKYSHIQKKPSQVEICTQAS